MQKMITRAAVGVIALTIATAASAQMDVEDAIKYRQAGYAFMGWNMGKIKAQVVDGAVEFNQGQVAAAANAIAAVANSGMGALYLPGSDTGIGFRETRVKPEFFQNMDDVGVLARDFVGAANALQEAAAGGDQGAIRTAFGRVGETCKACHDKYRAK